MLLKGLVALLIGSSTHFRHGGLSLTGRRVVHVSYAIRGFKTSGQDLPNFIYDFFRKGGLKRHLIKTSLQKSEGNVTELGANNVVFSSSNKIKVIDVGDRPLSQIIQSKLRPYFDVTYVKALGTETATQADAVCIRSYAPGMSSGEVLLSVAKRAKISLVNHRRGLLIVLQPLSEDLHVRGITDEGFDFITNKTLCDGDQKVQGFIFITTASTTATATSATATASISTSTSTSSQSEPRKPRLPIGIIGGGLGGSALALSLQRKNLPFIMFEKDVNFRARKQGYALTIQQGGTGLRELGLSNALLDAGVVSTAHSSFSQDGSKLGAYGASVIQGDIVKRQAREEPRNRGRFNIHVPRQALRDIIMQQIDPKHISWNKSLVALSLSSMPTKRGPEGGETESENSICLQFLDGSTQHVSIVVGADGIHSTVRKLMHSSTTAQPQMLPVADELQYLGFMVILGIAPIPSTSAYQSQIQNNSEGQSAYHSDSDSDNDSDSDSDSNCDIKTADGDGDSDSETADSDRTYVQNQWLNGSTRFFTMPYDRRNTMWQLSYPLDEEVGRMLATGGPNSALGDRLKAAALLSVSGWTSAVVDLISCTGADNVSGHPVYDREPLTPEFFDRDQLGSSDQGSSARITLLGDAAHPMSPFKGQGANQALVDAFSLAKALEGSQLGGSRRRPVREALRCYEQDMCERSREKVLKSRRAARTLHSPAALSTANITRAGAAEEALNSFQN